MPILETKNLTYIYGQGTPFEKTAVEDVSISIEKGEFIGVIGHTGSGKSTLIQTLNGLIRPTSGQVLLNGHDVWAEPKKIRAVRFQVGMVFQYPEYQLFEETVLKDIMFGPKNQGLSDSEARDRAYEAARFTGLREELLEKSPFELSGGEKRRAAIAGVIAMDPEVLILDEPTAGLDPRGRDVLLAQISQYHQKRGNTILLVSHSMEDVGRMAGRLLVMSGGHKQALAPTKEVFSRGEDLEKIGLRVPQITKIMQELQKQGWPVDPGVLTVDDALKQLMPCLIQKGQTGSAPQTQQTREGGGRHAF
jgi:energy-coupling factor transport system ATP-binding protein